MTEPDVETLTVLRGGATRGAESCAQHQRHFELAAGHVMYLSCLVHQLIHRQSKKVAEHDIHHRAHPGHGRAYPYSADAGFRNRRIDDALLAKFFHQTGKHFERRTSLCDVFADDEHRRIAAHLLGQGFIDSLSESDLTS